MQRSPEDHTESSPVVMSAAEYQQDTEAQPSQSKPVESSPVVMSAAEHQQDTEAHTTQSKPVDQEGKDKPDDPAQTTTTPTSMSLTPPLDKEPGVQSQAEFRENAGKADTDPTAKPSAPPGPAAESDGQGVKKQGKGSSDGMRYVSSRDTIPELEVMDLTSSQLSLHCIECHIIFSDFKGKERHMKNSHPAEYEQCILRNSLFACYVCDRHFTNSTELLAHQKSHTDKTPFKCPICSQSFKKSSELTAHKKVHFGQDGYACKECGKTCKTLTLLKYHHRKHSGETPYVCKDCGKRFPLSKALQKHIDSHSLDATEGVEVDTVSTAATKTNKADGASHRVYICSVCKATFKSLRTRQKHLITKHKFDAITNPYRAGLQNTPLISPISISQPALLQVEPNGPLQKVDANIDTEQLRKLIESLGNVQKVNKVVILGQVPPNAPPLQVRQVSEPAATVDLNLKSNLNLNPQTDFTGLKPAGSKTLQLDTLVSPMDQTIILEPITPEGQLETPSFSELGSYVAAEERVELTLIPAEQTERLEESAVHQNLQQPEISPMKYDPSVCQNEVVDLKENLEQTFILELTPALMPAAELEQSQSEPQNGIISFSLVQSTEQETPDLAPSDTVGDAKETKIPVPPLASTVELELTSTHPEEQDLSSCPSAPPETLIQAPSECEAKENTHSDTEKVGLEQMPAINEKTEVKDKQDVCEKFPAEDESCLSTDPQVETPSKLETKEDQQKSDLSVSVMSAQELVKVRKRKPARTFFFQGYMHDLVGSIYRDDFQIDAKPAKRQRTKKSCLVVKFGPQGKDKKSKKQKKPEQEQTQTQDNLIKSKTSPKKPPEKVQKVQTPKKTGKGKKTENASSGSDTKSPSTHTSQVKQVKDDAKKNKMKKQKETKEDVVHISKQKPVAMLKKKKAAKILQKDQPKNPKEMKGKKNLTKAQKVQKAEATDSNINQDSLLLLKGHKQPQLKVYKLDTLKASGPTQEDSPHDPQSSDISKAGGKKKGTRNQKNQKGLSLLSSLQATRQQPQIVPTKPKTTRKRKASLNVETEGVITSKRALECKDCGEKFSEVASLQKHKTTAHVIESPGLTYTNGNIFEGVSGFDLYRLPKEHGGVVRVMNAPTDWDTETEMGEMTLEDRDRGVSFPALIPSPSLQILPQDGEMGIYEHNGDSKTGIEDHFCTSSERQSSSDEPNNAETQSNVTTEASFPPSTEPKSSNTEEPAAPEEDTQEDLRKNLNFQPKAQGIADDDIKDDLLLEVDLVTVGEQEEKDDAESQNESNRGNKSNCEITNHKQVGDETREFSLTCQTVSCSTHQPEVKEEEEETLVQRRKEAVKEVAVTGQSRRELLKSDLISKTSSGLEQEHKPDECWIVYEKQLLRSGLEMADQEISTKTQPSPRMKTIKDTPPAASLLSVHATVEEAAAFELRSRTTGVDEVMNQRQLQGEEERESDQSPGIILDRVISSKQGATTDREMTSLTGRSSQSQSLGRIAENEVQVPEGHEIKVEENSSDTVLVAPTCQNRQSTTGVQPKHHQDIRSILVKEESNSVVNDTMSLHGSRRMRWNVEPVNGENTDIPLTEDGETTKDNSVTPEFNSNQCIFYPVKEEEREVLLGATHTITESSTPEAFCKKAEGSASAKPAEYQSADCNAHERRSSPLSYQESVVPGLPPEPSVGDLTDGQAASDSELQNPLDLRDFLLQSSDDEDTSGFELSEPQLNKEAEIMAYFNKNQTSSKQLPHQSYAKSLPNSASHLQAPHDDNRTEKPIDYFSEYFSWDTWVEIASCTNKLSKMPNPVTCREVARFVGIHIAMGTLRFPSARLYWEDLTKVSLIAEAMPLNRFLDLSRMLKLCSLNEPKENVTGQQLGDTPQSSQNLAFGHGDSRSLAEPNGSQTDADPLWKVRPLLHRFNEGCRSLKQPGDYAIDQHPVSLTGKIHNNRPSLQCTALIGLNGLITHLDLELHSAENQDAVEKMVPKGSTLFLCKQELSTPAMLERLLAAGIHGAGRVEGARGHIGDEFVSSDGKLMLRRTHCGFILSTAGNGQRNMVSLIDSFEKAQTSARLSRDLLNLYSTPLTVSLATCWPQAVLWHLTDAALLNSWLQYRQDYRAASAPMTFMAFRLEVSKALILSSGLDTQDSIPPQPPEEDTHQASEAPSPGLLEESPLPDLTTRYDGSGHWPEQLAEGEEGRCRFGDCQRTSRVLCLKCCVFLCISRNHNCFLNFHNQESLGEEQ